jgi:hypothetical protein
MKFMLLCIITVSLLGNYAFSMCYNNKLEPDFISELYLGDSEWFLEICKVSKFSHELMYVEIDSIAISCKSGQSLVKQSAYDAYLSSDAEYIVFNNDSMVSPLLFDNQSDSITVLFYTTDNKNEVEVHKYHVLYEKPLEANQSFVFYMYNCVSRVYITNEVTPGKANIITTAPQLSDNNPLIISTLCFITKSLSISISNDYNQYHSLIAIYNANGEEVFLHFLDGQQRYEVPIDSFNSGVYIVTLKNNLGAVASEIVYIP